MDTERNSNAVIEICNLTKKYGSKSAVNNVSLTVNRGEVLGFLGPNGAGKSTTMNILTGYISSTSGKVSIDGKDILEFPKEAKKKIGYLPENPPLYMDMTVGEYLEFVFELKRVELPKKEHLEGIMETVKISHVKDRMIKNLSKGYKQRVGLAQALIGDPEVLILDEPTVGLDPNQIMEIRDVIKVLGKDRTVILSTHILQEVTAVCDRIAIINQGKIAALGDLKTLKEEFGEKGKYLVKAVGSNTEIRNILSAINGIKEIRNAEKTDDGASSIYVLFEDGKDLRVKVFEAFASAGIPMIELRSMELSLEEIFIKVTSMAEEVEPLEEEQEIVADRTEEEKEETENESDI